MSSEAFIISAGRGTDPSDAVRRAVEAAGVQPTRVQDALFVFDGNSERSAAANWAREAGLVCPAVSISSGLRAIFFAAQSILSADVELNIVLSVAEGECAAIILGGTEAIGRWNLMPRGRLAQRSLGGPESAMRTAGITADDVVVRKDGDRVLDVIETLDELERGEAQWGMVQADALALLIERI